MAQFILWGLGLGPRFTSGLEVCVCGVSVRARFTTWGTASGPCLRPVEGGVTSGPSVSSGGGGLRLVPRFTAGPGLRPGRRLAGLSSCPGGRVGSVRLWGSRPSPWLPQGGDQRRKPRSGRPSRPRAPAPVPPGEASELPVTAAPSRQARCRPKVTLPGDPGGHVLPRPRRPPCPGAGAGARGWVSVCLWCRVLLTPRDSAAGLAGPRA